VVGWLRQRQVLLPAVKELEKLIARVVRRAHIRLWRTLVDQLSAGQANLLLDLVEVPEGRKVSPLELLRRGPRDQSGKALVEALERIAKVDGIGLGEMDLRAVPRRRVVDLWFT